MDLSSQPIGATLMGAVPPSAQSLGSLILNPGNLGHGSSPHTFNTWGRCGPRKP